MAGDNSNVCKDIELRIYPKPFCTSCNISSINKRLGLKSIIPNGTFQVDFMDIIPSTAPKYFTGETTFSKHILIVNSYSKISKLYGMDKITAE